MDKIGFKFLDATSHRARPRYSDAHLRVGREGRRAKSVSGEDLNFDAESRRLSHQGFYRAHHAVDLRQPSVGDDQDAGQRECWRCHAWTDMDSARLHRGIGRPALLVTARDGEDTQPFSSSFTALAGR